VTVTASPTLPQYPGTGGQFAPHLRQEIHGDNKFVTPSSKVRENVGVGDEQ